LPNDFDWQIFKVHCSNAATHRVLDRVSETLTNCITGDWTGCDNDGRLPGVSSEQVV